MKSAQPLPCHNYAAIHDLEEETSRHCPDAGEDTYSTSSLRSPSQEKESYSWQIEPDEPIDIAEAVSLSHKARYSCLRSSPLVCPNQSLVNEIDIIRCSRHLEGEERSMLSYSRAISVSLLFYCAASYTYQCSRLSRVRKFSPLNTKSWIHHAAYPRVITERYFRDLHELPFLGEKLRSMVLSRHPFHVHHSPSNNLGRGICKDGPNSRSAFVAFSCTPAVY